MGCGSSTQSTGTPPVAPKAQGLRRQNSYVFFSKRPSCPVAELKRAHDLLLSGTPDDNGQLSHVGFCSIFALRQDEYTDRLVKIFDIDNSGQVGFREFVYGLSCIHRIGGAGNTQRGSGRAHWLLFLASRGRLTTIVHCKVRLKT